MPSREAMERERLALVPDSAAPQASAEGPALGVSLLRASARARLGLVAVTVCILWLAVYWALA